MPNVEFAKKAVVKVTERSAFDKSFRNLLTTKCGTLTPILVDEIIPNTTVNLRLALSATLPPLASETFMNVNLKTEAFFVPSRLLMVGFTDFCQGNTDLTIGSYSGKLRVPVVRLVSGNANTTPYIGSGSLSDYLGLKNVAIPSGQSVDVSCLPFLAYHLIYDTWYRNSLVQRSPFEDNSIYNTSAQWAPITMRTKKPCSYESNSYYVSYLSTQFLDGVKLGELRQRNFGSDYFTTATPSPQNGTAQKISMALPSDFITRYGYIASDQGYELSNSGYNYELVTSNYQQGEGDVNWEPGQFSVTGYKDSNGNSINPSISFSIASLRAANSLQIWLERNNLSNDRWVDFLKVQYNANLKDSIAQRPVYLGSASFPVYSKGVYQTAADSNSGNNPFDTVGSRYGHAYAEGTDFIIDHYTAEEPGYIFVLASLVPEVTYSSGVAPYMRRYVDVDSYGEMANPILQNVGPEPIKCSELDAYFYNDSINAVFGYTDRFGSWMTRNHELHGLVSDGSSLESFALQRSFAQAPSSMLQISSSFLQIPTNYMDQVTAVNGSISNYGCWIDCYLDYKVAMPLAKYSIPSLQDPAYEHGQTVVVNRRGRIME